LQQAQVIAEQKPIIQTVDLHKVYLVGTQKVHALRGVEMEVFPGEFISIVGASGSGKSTLLNMLAGLEKPTRGEIHIAGARLEKLNEEQLVRFRRTRVGFIFQSFNLLPMYTAAENVALPLVFRGIPVKERMERARAMLEMVGLKDHMDHKPLQLSGGQQQRVGVARALVVQPEIVFADEPTGNLDSSTTADVMELMQKIVRECRQTLVMVTHDNHIAGFADRSFHIKDGKIIQITSRDEMPEEGE